MAVDRYTLYLTYSRLEWACHDEEFVIEQSQTRLRDWQHRCKSLALCLVVWR